MLISLIDLPFAISPVVAGLMFVVLFGRQGFLANGLIRMRSKSFLPCREWFWQLSSLRSHSSRELIPVMEATGTEQEQAALTLGASGWQTFWHVTLPSVRWGCFMGSSFAMRAPWVSLAPFRSCPATSRANGYDAAARGEALPERVRRFDDGGLRGGEPARPVGAHYTGDKTFLEWRTQREFALAQRSISETSPLAPSIQVPSRQQ